MSKTPRPLHGMPPTPHSARSAGTLSRTHSQTSNISLTMPSVEPFSFQFSQRNMSLTSRGNLTPKSSRGGELAASPRWSSAADLPAWQTQGSAMKVYVRVRPFSQREMAQKGPAHSTVRIDEENPSLITLLDPSRDFGPTVTFSFTRCFWSVFDTANAPTTIPTIASHAANNNNNNSSIASLGEMSNNSSSSNLQLVHNNNAHTNGAANFSRHGSHYTGSGSGAVATETAGVTHPPYASQEEVYRHVGQPILENTLDGFNGCVFAYGQTGSGKTFTMMGSTTHHRPAEPPRSARSCRDSLTRLPSARTANANAHQSARPAMGRSNLTSAPALPPTPRMNNDASLSVAAASGSDEGGEDVVVLHGAVDPHTLQGIIPRLSAQLFAALRHKRDTDPSCSSRVEVMYYEIYNEKVYDLIRPQRQTELKIRHHPTSGPYVDGLTSQVVMSEEEVMRVLRRGGQERHTAATLFNDHSSRSHAILRLDIVQVHLDDNDKTCTMRSKLNLVDLAGSERTGAAGAAGHEFTDGIKINLSLTVLGRVIDCLADLSQNKSLAVPVPYRDSNLTWLLCDSLGGNSQTSMIATVSPHAINFDEMRQTLRYASRAKQIVNRVVRNEDPQMRQIKLLMTEVERLQRLLAAATGGEEREAVASSAAHTREEVAALQQRITALESQLAEREATVTQLRAALTHAQQAAGRLVVPPLSMGGGRPFSALKGGPTVGNHDNEQLPAATADASRSSSSDEGALVTEMRRRLEEQTRSEATVTQALQTMSHVAGERAQALRAREELTRTMRTGFALTLHRLLDPCLSLVQDKETAMLRGMHALHRRWLARLQRRHRDELDEQRERQEAEMVDALERLRRQLGESHAEALRQTRAQAEEQRRDYEAHMEQQHRAQLERVAAAWEEERAAWAGERERAAEWRRQAERERAAQEEASMRAQAASVARSERHVGEVTQMAQQQEASMRAAESLVAAWESRAVAKEGELHRMRAMMYDRDYLHFRQMLRAKQQKGGNGDDHDDDNEDDDVSRVERQMSECEEDQRCRLMDILSRARRVQQLQKNNLHVLQNQLLERLNEWNSTPDRGHGAACEPVRHVEVSSA